MYSFFMTTTDVFVDDEYLECSWPPAVFVCVLKVIWSRYLC